MKIIKVPKGMTKSQYREYLKALQTYKFGPDVKGVGTFSAKLPSAK